MSSDRTHAPALASPSPVRATRPASALAMYDDTQGRLAEITVAMAQIDHPKIWHMKRLPTGNECMSGSLSGGMAHRMSQKVPGSSRIANIRQRARTSATNALDGRACAGLDRFTTKRRRPLQRVALNPG